MDLDYRISCGFPDNWKIDALARKLGEECIRPLLRLWAYCRLWRADDGSLSGLSDQRIEEVSKWAGPPGAFVAALVQLGMLDGEPLSRTVHQWTLHQPWAASEGRRIEAARTAGRKSAETKGHTLDGASTLRQRSVNAPSTHLPSPLLPSVTSGGDPPNPPLSAQVGGRAARGGGHAETAAAIWAFWVWWREPGKGAKFTQDRRRRVLARLAEGYGGTTIARAIIGITSSKFHRGENENGRQYVDLELVCRSGSKLEGFADMAKEEDLERSLEDWQREGGAAAALRGEPSAQRAGRAPRVRGLGPPLLPAHGPRS